MTIERRQLEDLIGDYEHAMRLVNQAGNILIDASDAAPALTEVTGQHGPFASSALISATADLSGSLYRAIMLLREALPKD